MKDNSPAKPYTPRKQLQCIIFAALLISFFFPTQDLSANRLNECLLEALTEADDSITVEQIREQCRQETGASATDESSQVISPDEKGKVSNTGIKAEGAGLTPDPYGPAEIILKTTQAKKPAFFPHKSHQDRYSCGKCHHGKDSSGMLVEYSANTIIKKCTTCHNSDMPNKDLNRFQSVGHKLCRACHRKNKNLALAKCSTCHSKN